jgi:hypothetical protein
MHLRAHCSISELLDYQSFWMLTIGRSGNHKAQIGQLVFRKLELVFMPGIRVGLSESGSAPVGSTVNKFAYNLDGK